MRKKNSQAMIEFIIYFGIIMFLTLIAHYVILSQIRNSEPTDTYTQLYITATEVKHQLQIANTLAQGFSSELLLPSDIHEEEYIVYIVNDTLYVSQNSAIVILSVVKGINMSNVYNSSNNITLIMQKTEDGLDIS